MQVRSLGRELTDGVVTLRSPLPGDAAVLVAGRDAEFHRFLGAGSPEPAPTAVVLDGARKVVGWVDYDVDRAWLSDGEVNIGFHVVPEHRRRGIARRSLVLLVTFLEEDDEFQAATLLIDPSNAPSIAVAERAGFDRSEDVDGQLFYKRRATRTPAPAAAHLDSPHDRSALAGMLAGYTPRSDAERADLGRIQTLVERADPWNRSAPLHATASAIIVDRATEQVLLRWHDRQQSWLQVGGHADPGECDPLEVARREGAEEAGLGDLVEWPGLDGPIHLVIVPVPAGATEPAHEHADIRYLLATEQAHLARPENDRAAVRWLSFDEAIDLTDEDNVKVTLDRVRDVVSG